MRRTRRRTPPGASTRPCMLSPRGGRRRGRACGRFQGNQAQGTRGGGGAPADAQKEKLRQSQRAQGTFGVRTPNLGNGVGEAALAGKQAPGEGTMAGNRGQVDKEGKGDEGPHCQDDLKSDSQGHRKLPCAVAMGRGPGNLQSPARGPCSDTRMGQAGQGPRTRFPRRS